MDGKKIGEKIGRKGSSPPFTKHYPYRKRLCDTTFFPLLSRQQWLLAFHPPTFHLFFNFGWWGGLNLLLWPKKVCQALDYDQPLSGFKLQTMWVM